MKSTSSRFVSVLIFSSLAYMPFSASVARADYLVKPVPVVFVETVRCVCCKCKKVKHHARPCKPKKHHVYKHRKHRRIHSYRSEITHPCTYFYYPQAEPVTFVSGAPSGRGRWVDTSGCDNYDPDMSTGDDDPTIYPGMNIDN